MDMNIKHELEIANKIADNAIEELSGIWAKRIQDIVLDKSRKGKQHSIVYLSDYSNENYCDEDFYRLVAAIQKYFLSANIKNIALTGGWSNTNNSLYIIIHWNKKWRCFSSCYL